MNELMRSQYLGAMGIDSYISRQQLPGAAVTRRLAIAVPKPAPGETFPQPLEAQNDASASQTKGQIRPPMPVIEGFSRPALAAKATPAAVVEVGQPVSQTNRPASTAQVRFSLAAVIVGRYLWIEELAGIPLAREQVQLIQGMARALGARETASVSQFDWPMHNNQQLDLGAEAARASVAGFLRRHIDQRHCTGLVVLGASAAQRVELEQMGSIQSVVTRSTVEMLTAPALKKVVWKDLRTLLG